MKLCATCGEKNAGTVTVCGGCGVELPAGKKDRPSVPTGVGQIRIEAKSEAKPEKKAGKKARAKK